MDDVNEDTTGHEWHECEKPCTTDYCNYCDGGLSSCDVCHSIEGATTTNCPDEPMSEELIDQVYKGHKDFKNGEWVDLPSKFSPAYWHDRRNWDENNPDYVEGETHKREIKCGKCNDTGIIKYKDIDDFTSRQWTEWKTKDCVCK